MVSAWLLVITRYSIWSRVYVCRPIRLFCSCLSCFYVLCRLTDSLCGCVFFSDILLIYSAVLLPVYLINLLNKSMAVRKVATPLRELTCHMGSHSVTYHPAEVTFPPLAQPKLVLDLAAPERCKAELSCRIGKHRCTTNKLPKKIQFVEFLRPTTRYVYNSYILSTAG